MTLDVVSIGHLACAVQASVPRIRHVLDRLQVTPELRINNVDYYNAEVVDRLYVELEPAATVPLSSSAKSPGA